MGQRCLLCFWNGEWVALRIMIFFLKEDYPLLLLRSHALSTILNLGFDKGTQVLKFAHGIKGSCGLACAFSRPLPRVGVATVPTWNVELRRGRHMYIHINIHIHIPTSFDQRLFLAFYACLEQGIKKGDSSVDYGQDWHMKCTDRVHHICTRLHMQALQVKS